MSEVSVSEVRASHHRFLDVLRDNVVLYRWLILYVVAYAVGVSCLLAYVGRPFWTLSPTYFLSALLPPFLALLFYVIGVAIEHTVNTRTMSISGIKGKLRDDKLLTYERIGYVLIPFLLVPFFASFFTACKSAIPALQPYVYDTLFMDIDRWLHFGTAPWEWLQPVLGFPLVTSIMSFLYNLWMPLMFFFLWWFVLTSKNPALRFQYLFAFILTWSLLGSALAIVSASVGPVYYEHFVSGPNPYVDLLAYHQEASEIYMNWAMTAQEYIWDSYNNAGNDVGEGISAMPSLHVAVAFLMALGSWQLSRRLGALMYLYLWIILLGSVHLAWHYAIDGYVSIIVTYGIWRLAGYIVRRHTAIPRLDDPAPDTASA